MVWNCVFYFQALKENPETTTLESKVNTAELSIYSILTVVVDSDERHHTFEFKSYQRCVAASFKKQGRLLLSRHQEDFVYVPPSLTAIPESKFLNIILCAIPYYALSWTPIFSKCLVIFSFFLFYLERDETPHVCSLLFTIRKSLISVPLNNSELD